MPVRKLRVLPLMVAVTLTLVACSSVERRTDVFGSGSDLDYGIAPSGPIGPISAPSPAVTPTTVTAPSPAATATVTAPSPVTAPAPAAMVPITTKSDARPIYEGYAQPTHEGYAATYEGYVAPYPTYPAAQGFYYEEHAEAPPVAVEQPAPVYRSAHEMTLGEIKAEMERADMLREEVRSIMGAPPAAAPAPTAPAPRYRARAVPGACKTCTKRGSDCNPCGYDTYIGGFFGIFPGLGFGIEFQREFDRSKVASWMWDVSLVYQDLYDVFNDESLTGKYNALRLGVLARGAPRSRIHPTARAGITWFRVNGNADTISVADFSSSGRDEDYFGVYLAVGVDFDITDCVSTGPEVGYVGGIDNDGSWGGTLEARWHIRFKF